MSELPNGWIDTILGEITAIEMGQSPKGHATNTEGQGYPLVGGASEFVDGRIIATRFTRSPTKLSQQGDILFCIRATIGKVAVSDAVYCLGRGVAGLRADHISPDWLRYFLLFSAARIEEAGTGTTFRQVDKATLTNWPASLPPLTEQRRIVAKLDSLTGRTGRAGTELGLIPALIARYKQEILSAAFSGELTRDWRSARGLSAPKTVELGELVTELRYGTAKKCHPQAKGIAVLRIPNVVSGRIDLKDLKYAELDKREVSKLALADGDILIVRSNGSVDLVGRPALVTSSEAGLAYAGYLIRLRPRFEIVVPRFLTFLLQSPQIRRVIETDARSTSGVHNVNSAELAALRVPQPELAEQIEIVRRIESTFAWLDRVAAEQATALRLSPRLDQAILARAFRGELVPQDPDDEPASVLLARIRAERAAIPKGGRKVNLRGAVEIELASGGALTATEKEEDMNKTRIDVSSSHLCDIVKQAGGEIRADALWRASEMQIDEFYKLLRDDVAAKRLKESKDKASITDAR